MAIDPDEDVERELALALGEVAPAEVATHPLVTALAIDRPVSERLVSTYYDTADRALAAEGIVLRVRRCGRSLVQTVKRGGPKGAGLASRDEWETPLPSRTPHWPPAVPGETGALLARIAAAGPAVPLFVTDFTRQRRRLATPGGDVVELAIDVGAIRAGRAAAPVAEVELELKRGNPAGLFELALGLCADLPLGLQVVSKGERGLLLAAGGAPKAIMAGRATLDAAMTVGEAASVVLGSAAGQAVTNLPAIVEGSEPVEGVHQMRVGLRRFRAALAIFAPHLADRDRSHVRDLLRPSLAALGPARDLDVFLDETVPPVVAGCEGDAGVAAFLAQAQATRDQGRQALVGHLAAPEHTRMWLELGRWLAGHPVEARAPVEDFAHRVLRKRARRVKRAARDADGGPLEALHALRIEVKKLRYACEFFASLYDEARTRSVLKALRNAQDSLGHLNDLAVCDAVVARIEADAPKGARRAVARGARRIAGMLHARHGDTRAAAEAAYAEFAAKKPFWK